MDFPRRGDIYYVAFSKDYCTDPTNPAARPGIIVSNNRMNEHSTLVEVVYLTTKDKKPMPTHVNIVCKHQSTALCETINTVEKTRLDDYIRACTTDELERLDKALLYSLGIDIPASVTYKKLYEDLLDKVVNG